MDNIFSYGFHSCTITYIVAVFANQSEGNSICEEPFCGITDIVKLRMEDYNLRNVRNSAVMIV
jgi:hypothetical protein